MGKLIKWMILYQIKDNTPISLDFPCQPYVMADNTTKTMKQYKSDPHRIMISLSKVFLYRKQKQQLQCLNKYFK